jgi:predicted RNA-binding protein with PIN domain
VPTKIIIDGYNFLWQEALFRDEAITSFEKGREKLLQWLSAQAPLQNFEVMVVFDAHRTYQRDPSRESYEGIHVVYTAGGQTADELIRELAAEYTAGAIVVSSDREVARHAEKKGCGVLGSREFQTLLANPEAFALDPSRKLPKSKRKAIAKLIKE